MKRLGTVLLVVLCIAAISVFMVRRTLDDAIIELNTALSRATGILQGVHHLPPAGGRDASAVVVHLPGPDSGAVGNWKANGELELMEDAQALASGVRQTTKHLLAVRNVEARSAVPDTSYLLPCGDAMPRLVASRPAREGWARPTPLSRLPIGLAIGSQFPDSVADPAGFPCEIRRVAFALIP